MSDCESNPRTAGNKTPLLHGLVAAAFTPMQEDGSLNLGAVPEVVEYVLGQGADGLFVCGTTGESSSLTTEERMAVVETYTAAVGHRVPLVVHVGHNSLADAEVLAGHAASIGVDAIAAAPPSYFRPSTIGGLVECLAQIASAAPELPLYYYHIPALTNVQCPMIDLLREAGDRLPSLAGIKYSCLSLDDMLACICFDGGRYNILFGADEMLLAGLSMGAAGAVGSTYNFLAPTYKRVIDALSRGDLAEAQACQAKATRVVHAILTHGGHNALKASMNMLGVDCGPTRLPVPTLSAEQVTGLRKSLSETEVGGRELARQAT